MGGSDATGVELDVVGADTDVVGIVGGVREKYSTVDKRY